MAYWNLYKNVQLPSAMCLRDFDFQSQPVLMGGNHLIDVQMCNGVFSIHPSVHLLGWDVEAVFTPPKTAKKKNETFYRVESEEKKIISLWKSIMELSFALMPSPLGSGWFHDLTGRICKPPYIEKLIRNSWFFSLKNPMASWAWFHFWIAY